MADAFHATPELLSRLKNVPASFRLAARAALRMRLGRLGMSLPDGRRLVFEGDEPGPAAEINLKDWAFARRVIAGGPMGFAESYIAGEWDTPDLPGALALLSANLDKMRDALSHNPVVRAANRMVHALRRNTRAQAKRNIHAHYDLGNDFYALWLDRTMTYSSALYEGRARALEDAQTAKYRSLADRIDLGENNHVLEIGSGWGGFAEYAAKERGAKVTGVTISREQYDFSKARLQREGLSEKADIKLVDYRDVEGSFDRVASIEMFEAVGERYWPDYFAKIASALKPGGKAGLQIITIRDDIFEDYRRRVDFIQRHVFPGGMLPSVARLKTEVEKAGLAWRDALTFGTDYADTLAEWNRRFQRAWDDIVGLNQGFDERFRRLWRYYLAYCEAGFRTGRIDVGQFTIAKA